MESNRLGLSSNGLKLLAMLCMTVDHLGLILLPQYIFLRMIGRLAFPIYAWMIAEGCRYTRNMGRYLGLMLGMGVLYQVVCTGIVGLWTMNILLTFSMSIGLCWLLQKWEQTGKWFYLPLLLAALGSVFFLTDIVPLLFRGKEFSIDYGLLGVLLPVALYLSRGKVQKLLVGGVILCCLAYWSGWDVQWMSLLALPLLALYNGTRGKWKLKWLFYIYYPAHLCVLWVIWFLCRK